MAKGRGGAARRTQRPSRIAQEVKTMKAIAVFPGKADTAHLADIPEPRLEDVPDGRGVLVRIVRVGLDGTDREINAGEYGAPPPGDEYLVIGHENLGVV